MVNDVKWDEEIKKRSSAYSTAYEKSKLVGGAASTEIPLPESIKRMCYLEVNAASKVNTEHYTWIAFATGFRHPTDLSAC
jgi:hypothetical protein